MNKILIPTLVGTLFLGLLPTARAEGRNLGKLMCIGDSISHGFQAPSYRWQLHKLLVDNGVGFAFVGVTRGNRHPGQSAGPHYRGVPFNNRHSAMSAERAYEIAGRINESGRLGNSNIFDWLLLDKSYTGDFKLDATEIPDTVIILIGTNDMVIDGYFHGGIGKYIEQASAGMLGAMEDGKRNGKGDMDTIIGAIRQANSKADIYVMAVPTWSHLLKRAAKAEDFAAISSFNKEYKGWVESKGMVFVPTNDGMVDVTRTDKPFASVDAFFNAVDHLHPTRQGDLLMAGNVAKAMGIPGRTAGLERAAVEGDARTPRTVEFPATVGNGAVDGWKADALVTLTFAAAGKQGKLTLSESQLQWQGNPLICKDFSANKEPVRIAFIEEGNSGGVDSGFYVWLGDRLVGEALQGTATDAADGYTLETAQPGVQAAASDKAVAPPAP